MMLENLEFSQLIKFIDNIIFGIFEDEGWSTLNCSEGNIDPYRLNYNEAVLKEVFLSSLEDRFTGYPKEFYQSAYEKFTAIDSKKSFYEINKEKHQYLTEGISLTFENNSNELETLLVPIIDFYNPSSNDYMLFKDFTYEEKNGNLRVIDYVGFINGIPVLLIEVDKEGLGLSEKVGVNISNNKRQVPSLLYYNAFIIGSNVKQSLLGSITDSIDRYSEWKEYSEGESYSLAIENILRGVCNQENILDIIKNFTFFSDKTQHKMIAKNHQVNAVNAALDFYRIKKIYRNSNEDSKQLGIVNHVLGSGKLYTMIFYVKKLRKIPREPLNFIILTDRKDIEDQVNIALIEMGIKSEEIHSPKSSSELKLALQKDKPFLVSTIQKFNFDVITNESENIIVVSYDIFRLSESKFLENIKKVLPNASFVGFDGDISLKHDNSFSKIFGESVSIYGFDKLLK